MISCKIIPRILEPYIDIDSLSYFIEDMSDKSLSISLRKGTSQSSPYVASLEAIYAEPNTLQVNIYNSWVELAREHNCFLWVTKRFSCADQAITDQSYIGLVIEMMACLLSYKEGCLARADGSEWKGKQIRKFCKLNGSVGIFNYDKKKK